VIETDASLGSQGLEVPVTAPRKGRLQRVRVDRVAPILLTCALLGVWELWVRAGHVKPYVMPSFSDVAKTMWTQHHYLLSALWVTVEEILIGFGVSVAIGIPLAIAIVTFRALEYSLYPLLVASQVIPKLAIAPLFIIWFGFGWIPKIFLVFLIAFFPIVIDSIVGFRAIEIEKLYLARSMGASRTQIFVRFRLPQALPSIFSGLKLAGTLAVIGAIVAEFVGSDTGIGHAILAANATLQTETMFAGVLYITIVGIILFLAIDLLERLMLPWHVSRRAGAVVVGSA
jgi:NitT/TauT family transport system permease protein